VTNYKILGVNGGNGVMLFPFRKQITGNIEIRSVFHTPEDIQWKLNFQVAQDKNPVKFSKALVDVIIGHPDCGHSSVLAYSRAKKLSDPKENKSFNVYVRMVRYYQPKVFLMENLPKMLSNFTDEEFQSLFPNHRLIKMVDSVAYWGNSQQSRIRLVMIGIRQDMDDSIDKEFQKPIPSSELKSADELTKGLATPDPNLCNVREPEDHLISLYYKDRRSIEASLAQRLWLRDFKDGKRWPVEGSKFVNQPGIYINRKGDLPLTVRKQNRQFNHLGLMLTPREMARIQGVPDSFKLWYDPKRSTYSINKARVTIAKTPPMEISYWFKSILDKVL